MNQPTVFAVYDTVPQVLTIISLALISLFVLVIGLFLLAKARSRVAPLRTGAQPSLHGLLSVTGLAAGPAAGLLWWTLWGWLGGFTNHMEQLDNLPMYLGVGALVGIPACLVMLVSNRRHAGQTLAVSEQDYAAAQEHAANHREEISSSQQCGCFHCLAIFQPSAITDWVDEDGGKGTTAICPECGVKSVIGCASGYPISPGFLQEVRRHCVSPAPKRRHVEVKDCAATCL